MLRAAADAAPEAAGIAGQATHCETTEPALDRQAVLADARTAIARHLSPRG
jgi:hypothetical protein